MDRDEAFDRFVRSLPNSTFACVRCGHREDDHVPSGLCGGNAPEKCYCANWIDPRRV